jgi:hypothetical protein
LRLKTGCQHPHTNPRIAEPSGVAKNGIAFEISALTEVGRLQADEDTPMIYEGWGGGNMRGTEVGI